jgi:hypothetical protein
VYSKANSLGIKKSKAFLESEASGRMLKNDQRGRRFRFKKGNVPFTKGLKQIEYMSPESINNSKATRFEKGRLPHNTKYDGHERFTKDGYIEIRISIGVYRQKHIVEWEKHNGLIPPSYCILCQDGNKLNTDHNNWKLISRAENMLRNSSANFPEEIIPSLVLVSKLKKTINQLQNGKEHTHRPQ